MRLEDYDVDQRYKAEVKEVKRITPEGAEEDIRTLELEVPTRDFDYHVGQSIGVIVPGPHDFGHDEHFRLYTVADTQEAAGNGDGTRVEICVKRCSYIDDFSGERHRGIASNYLCDRQAGDTITITGPYGLPFSLPEDKSADLLLIGLGTGIAPFRAFVRHIYEDLGGWEGRVRLYYGARSGLEMAYMNDKQDDFANYYDEETFEAFTAVSPRPHMDDPIPLDEALERNKQEVWDMVQKPDTHIYVAGLEHMLPRLNRAFAEMAGSEQKWLRRKAELVAGERWTELVY